MISSRNPMGMDALRQKPFVTSGVSDPARIERMFDAIDLDSQLCGGTVEIEYVRADGVLTAEAEIALGA